ncbi:MAG: CusA/CzcA family heavy metal efflux RND transporter [Kofleriaceae bacterium]|nr:CusA/CzcA family heavy metal efflux RND transporter [Kofleriaceae bacterium]
MKPAAGTGGVIGGAIAASARNPLLVILVVVALSAWGWLSLRRAPLDAIPDLSDAQVIIFTEWMGRSPDLVEDQITYPISTSLIAAPGVKYVRGQSMFGMSFVYVIFEDGTDMYWARSRVLEYLNEAQARLPEGVSPTLGPDATGVGWVFEYAIVDRKGTHDLSQLRSLQDWNVRYALESVPGVAEVASVGGFEKQYQIAVDPTKLRAFGVTLQDVMMAVRRSNEDVGGQVIEIAGHEHVIRGRGYVKSLRDLELIPVKLPANAPMPAMAAGTSGAMRARASPGRERASGAPVFVKDVGYVSVGPDIRRGIAELDGKGEVAGGIVIMRYGENALDVIDAVKARIAEIEKTLPDGVDIVITYDRSGLIRASIDTLTKTLVEEMIVVSIVIFVFLLHVRSALIPILTVPLGILLAFIPMYFQGLTANIMSLGGIAVAIGAMVDASIIIIDNIHKKLEEWEHAGRPGDRMTVVVAAMQEVGPSIFFSLLVITVSFIPVFTLEGTEGRLFKPLAFTKTYSMGFAAVLAVTLTPALAAIIIRGKIRGEDKNPINRLLIWAYSPVVRFVVRHRWAVVGTAVVAMALTVPAYLRLGNEFMPPLNEGAILYMPTAPPGMSDAEAARILQEMDKELHTFPEVESVFGKMGRAETATDPAPIGMVETVIVLAPRDRWRPGMTWDQLIREMDAKLQFPGMPNIWWMPIQTRTEMLSTGIRSKLGVQVFGDNLVEIEEASIAIERTLANVPGTRSAFADRSTGGFYVDVVARREEAARYGMTVGDVNDAVQIAIGGMNVSETVEGRERYAINLRYAREYRDDPEALKDILVATPTGAQVPLSQVAEIKTVTGPPMIRSEDGRLVGFVFVDTDRPIADYVHDARKLVERDVKLAPGIRVDWVGQFKYLERAKEKLKIVVPITLLIVFLLLYFNTRSLVETGIVLLAVPFSLIGAIWLLCLLDYNMSVAVWVGLIALAGLDAETGVIMLLYLTLSHRRYEQEGRLRNAADLEDAIVEGAAKRIRPKLMTVLTMMIGLVPVLWSTGAGADVMKRIAAPMIGGLATSFLLELTVYPAIFAIWKRRRNGFPTAAARPPSPSPTEALASPTEDTKEPT